MTSRKDQWQYWAHKDEPYSFVTVKDFVEAFQSFHVGQQLGDELANPFDKTKSNPIALTTKKYGVNRKELLRACAGREFLLMKRNSFVYIFKATQVSNIQAIMLFTTYQKYTKLVKNFVYALMKMLNWSVSCILFLGSLCMSCSSFSAYLFSYHDSNIISTN